MLDAQTQIQARSLSVAFRRNGERLDALHDVRLDVAAGEFVGIVGPSGSGKTTLLNVLGGLLVPTAGKVLVDGRDLYALSDARRARLRSGMLSFIFQTYHLHPQLSVRQNVELPFAFARQACPDAQARLNAALEELGLTEMANAAAGALSSGQKQRVVVARALVSQAGIVLADEPTANLDPDNASVVMNAIHRANRERGATVLIVAHDADALVGATRTLRLDAGRLVA